jgi:hypothetical protein
MTEKKKNNVSAIKISENRIRKLSVSDVDRQDEVKRLLENKDEGLSPKKARCPSI